MTDFYFKVLNAEQLSPWDRFVLRLLDLRARLRCPGLYASFDLSRDLEGFVGVDDDFEVFFHKQLFGKMSRRTKVIIGFCSVLLRQPVILEKGRERFWLDEAVRHANEEP